LASNFQDLRIKKYL